MPIGMGIRGTFPAPDWTAFDAHARKRLGFVPPRGAQLTPSALHALGFGEAARALAADWSYDARQ